MKPLSRQANHHPINGRASCTASFCGLHYRKENPRFFTVTARSESQTAFVGSQVNQAGKPIYFKVYCMDGPILVFGRTLHRRRCIQGSALVLVRCLMDLSIKSLTVRSALTIRNLLMKSTGPN